MAKAEPGRPRNYKLESGVYRYSRSAMYGKKAIYKFVKKTTPKAAVAKKDTFVEKKIGGAKNGGTRMVRVKSLKADYPLIKKAAKGTSKNFFSKHKRTVRSSLSAGTVAIILAGAHKGKRVVVLKQLASGLLLISGPFALNGCPLRRVNQAYLVATKTKLDIASVKVPENVDDAYFKRAKKAKAGKKEGDIFESKKEEYKPSEQRKTDQAAVDKQLMEVLSKHAEAKVLKQYLRSPFGLSKGEHPHKMVF